MLLPPQEIVPEQPEPTSRPNQPRETTHNEPGITERATAMLSVNHPEVVPPDISTAPNLNKPLPETGLVRITDRDLDAGPGVGPGSPTGGRQVVQPAQIVTLTQPPPPPDPPKPPKVISKGPITGLAISLPKPAYPEMAKRIRATGRSECSGFG